MPRISFRRDTAENWTEFNPILHAGEFGYELDTNKAKIGNGTDQWVDLPYFGGTGGVLVYVQEDEPDDTTVGALWFDSDEPV